MSDQIIWVRTPTTSGWHILHSYRYGPSRSPYSQLIYAFFLTMCGYKLTGKAKLQRRPMGVLPTGGRKNAFRGTPNVCDHCSEIAFALEKTVDITDQIKEESFA